MIPRPHGGIVGAGKLVAEGAVFHDGGVAVEEGYVDASGMARDRSGVAGGELIVGGHAEIYRAAAGDFLPVVGVGFGGI